MSPLYTSSFTPNPTDARDVLAFLMCPLTAFVPDGDEDEMAAVAEMIAPARAEAIRRWQEAERVRLAN